VLPFPGSLLKCGKVDLAECSQLLSSSFDSFVLIQSAQEQGLSLHLALYFAFWYSSFCFTEKEAED